MKYTNKHSDLLQAVNTNFEISRGYPQPFGSSLVRGGINFAVFCPHALFVSLVLFSDAGSEILMEFPLDPQLNRTGNIWHAFIKGLDAGIVYGYRITCEENHKPHFKNCSPEIILLDPYARATCGGEEWGNPQTVERKGEKHTFRLSQIVDDNFNWEFDRPLHIPLRDTIIYELHIRGFTQHNSSAASSPGTFSGLVEKIPYLQELGITAVELMPVTDFDETHPGNINEATGGKLLNLWGYDPLSFFAPKAAYAKHSAKSGAVYEFKEMVKAFHRAGIEIILDIVFNHTGEGNEKGPIYHYKGLGNSLYYLLDSDDKYLNYSGCGNTLNCNHPVVRDMIIESLRYWVTEMHVDGFRFDLASILGRGRNGEVLANPPLIERIAEDPILANTKLIAEAWDAGGLYQVGEFPHFQRWMEWNGKFRDDVRKFVRGDSGMVRHLATRLAGSSDLYQDDGREPYHSVNFITAHDGFPLYDLVSYNEKHNWGNGEQNSDGSNDNLSWNCGAEGETDDPEIINLRNRQIKNYAAILLLSQGVPMILAGDEFGRTQKGNNNAYCQDNEISWIDWNLASKNKDLLRFFKLLIQFRRKHNVLRRIKFEVRAENGIQEMSWHGLKLNKPDWSDESKWLAVLYNSQESDPCCLYLMINSDTHAHRFDIPASNSEYNWHRALDTASKPPQDFAEEGKESPISGQNSYNVSAHSVVVLISKKQKESR